MAPRLTDLLDLEYFMARDLAPGVDRQSLLERDREIHKEITASRPQDAPPLDESDLIFSWLELRRLLELAHAGPSGLDALPGRAFTRCARMAALVFLSLGLGLGFFFAFSFLAYHGSTPVNVALFFLIFVLVPLVFSMAGVRVFYRGLRGRTRPVPWTTALVSGAMARLGRVKGDAGPALQGLEPSTPLFWSLFQLSGLAGLGLSLGMLGGTLVKVAVSDLAFGWQSTLVTSPQGVHDLVALIAAPWSWMVPDWAHPGLAQISGSRIILKEGLDTLATADLVSWWPFLCFSLLVYNVLPRLVLVLAGAWAGMASRRQFDLTRPEFRQLLGRMQSPEVEIRFRETPVTPPRPREHAVPGPRSTADPRDLDPVHGDEDPAEPRVSESTGAEDAGLIPALVLAPAEIWEGPPGETMVSLIAQQFHLEGALVAIDLDEDADARALAPRLEDCSGPVILLQEVWQPPIRGLLFYISQLRSRLDAPLWVLLCQGPERESQAIAGDDVNARVWEEKINALGDPLLRVVRVEV